MLRTGSRILAAVLLVGLVVESSQTYAADPFRRSGFRLDESDLPFLQAAAEKLYLVGDVTVGTSAEWINPETGNRGTVRLVEKHEHEGLPCRRLLHDIVLTRIRDPYRFTVDRCRTVDGEWKILTR
jgi:surface antigen